MATPARRGHGGAAGHRGEGTEAPGLRGGEGAEGRGTGGEVKGDEGRRREIILRSEFLICTLGVENVSSLPAATEPTKPRPKKGLFEDLIVLLGQ
ncbi:hypothetical protein DV515_00006212, partial [Chloebia gouldiae]